LRRLHRKLVEKGARIWSASRLRKLRCPKAFELKYIAELPEPDSSAARVGRAVHSALALCVEQGLAPAGALAEAAAEMPLSPEEEAEAERLLGLALKLNPVSPARLIGCEEEMAAEAGDGVWIYGILDALEGSGTEAVITDWKTGYRPYTREEAEKDLQSRIYAWLVCQEYGHVEEVHVRYVFVRNGAVAAASFTRKEALEGGEKVREIILRADRRIREGRMIYPPSPGAHCAACGYVLHCPAGRDGWEPRDAREAARMLLALEARTQALKELLRKYVEERGPLAEEGKIWGFWPRTSYEFAADFDRVVEEIRQIGLDPAAVLRPRADKTPRELVERGLLREETRFFFGRRSAKEEDQDESSS